VHTLAYCAGILEQKLLPLRLGYAAPSERSCALLRSILLSYTTPY
jgi:hypothetical protein